jgi:tRNA nucleotidyltransferase (CCA-adding enzyme)
MLLEVTTYRIDGDYSDNRHPKSVFFTCSLNADLSRRDFTINAMAYNPSVGIVDYYNGNHDLSAGVIRCVGNPDTRFKEDGLRILRAIRFASTLGFHIQADTARAVHDNKELLRNISDERIASEFNKILMGDGVKNMLLQFYDVIGIFIPEILPTVHFEQNNPHHYLDVWGHIVESIASAPKILPVRLTMFFHDIAKPSCYSVGEDGTGHFYHHPPKGAYYASKILQRLRYDNATIMRVRDLVSYHDSDILPDKRNVKRWLNRIGEETLRQLLEVRKADTMAQTEECRYRIEEANRTLAIIEEVLNENQCFSLKDLALNGADLRALGLAPGPKMGETLKCLMELVLNDEVPNTKESLSPIADKYYEEIGEEHEK